MINKYICLTLLLVLAPTVSACGWFTYEDIEDTRSYYNPFDKLEGIEDSILVISRYPTPYETKVNIYSPMSYNG